MDDPYVSLARRTLEEIRQKKAVERFVKASSASDLNKIPPSATPSGVQHADNRNQLSENDVGNLVSQLRDLQTRNGELEEENRRLSSELLSREEEIASSMERVDALEHGIIPSLRKSIKDIAMEKDAAVVANEDLSARLRSTKKLLEQAEEDQYRAEEDASALRAELLNSAEHQLGHNPLNRIASMDEDPIHELQSTIELLKRDLSESQLKVSALSKEKEDLYEKIAVLAENASSRERPRNELSTEIRGMLQGQLHDMAVATERLEASRQILLLEIDSQSSEIEALFEENSNLSSSYKEAMETSVYWENQVRDSLKKNEELVHMVEGRVPMLDNNDATPAAEIHSLRGVQWGQGAVAREHGRAEALAMELRRVTDAYANLTRSYTPVLRNIEKGLLQLKNNTCSPLFSI